MCRGTCSGLRESDVDGMSLLKWSLSVCEPERNEGITCASACEGKSSRVSGRERSVCGSPRRGWLISAFRPAYVRFRIGVLVSKRGSDVVSGDRWIRLCVGGSSKALEKEASGRKKMKYLRTMREVMMCFFLVIVVNVYGMRTPPYSHGQGVAGNVNG